MNYNQFYRKRDREKRKLQPFEKVNARRLSVNVFKSVLAGMAAGALLVILIRLFS